MHILRESPIRGPDGIRFRGGAVPVHDDQHSYTLMILPEQKEITLHNAQDYTMALETVIRHAQH